MGFFVFGMGVFSARTRTRKNPTSRNDAREKTLLSDWVFSACDLLTGVFPRAHWVQLARSEGSSQGPPRVPGVLPGFFPPGPLKYPCSGGCPRAFPETTSGSREKSEAKF